MNEINHTNGDTQHYSGEIVSNNATESKDVL